MSWWLTQWLCVNRHCAYATVWDDALANAEEMVTGTEAEAKRSGINPWCGICGGALQSEHRKFPPSYKTRDQVVAAMNASQAEQLARRALLDELGETFDSRRAASKN